MEQPVMTSREIQTYQELQRQLDQNLVKLGVLRSQATAQADRAQSQLSDVITRRLPSNP
jgi:hypothetical protein